MQPAKSSPVHFWGQFRLASFFASYILARMANRWIAMPMVEVTSPDGDIELWAAATSHIEAVEVVQKAIPRDYDARLTSQRLPRSPRLENFCAGEVRKVFP
jgi:hypothetical protein